MQEQDQTPPPKPTSYIKRAKISIHTVFFSVLFLCLPFLLFFTAYFLEHNFSYTYNDYSTFLIAICISVAASATTAITLALGHRLARIFANITFFLLACSLSFLIISIGNHNISSSVGWGDLISITFLTIMLLTPPVALAIIFNRSEQIAADLNSQLLKRSTRNNAVFAAIVGLAIFMFMTFMTVKNNSSSEVYPQYDPYYSCYGLECVRNAEKPVIYLYPQTETDVSVKLSFAGTLTTTYPELGNGWYVTARPDGTLINKTDGLEYSYLYWEGTRSGATYDMSQGFVVKGSDTSAFLQKTLSALGLTPKEYNEFIVYWLPKMQPHPYNLIHFATPAEYDAYAPLTITPTPDSMLRIFMAFQPLDAPVTNVTPQLLQPFTRTGFTVVEWGGSELK